MKTGCGSESKTLFNQLIMIVLGMFFKPAKKTTVEKCILSMEQNTIVALPKVARGQLIVVT
jgi:hypothetical protein